MVEIPIWVFVLLSCGLVAYATVSTVLIVKYLALRRSVVPTTDEEKRMILMAWAQSGYMELPD